MSTETEGEDLERKGLVGHSYDSFFAIDKRIRKFGDFYVPLRQGLRTSQIAVFIVSCLVTIILQALLISPLLSLIGIKVGVWAFLTIIIGVPALISCRSVKPMPYHKSIAGTLRSLIRTLLDSPVHRRGVPIKTPKRPVDQFVQHYLREWAVASDYTAELGAEAEWTDPRTEQLLARSTGHVDLQTWMDDQALAHAAEQDRQKQHRTTQSHVPHDRRGSLATVRE